jgi:glycosyltransferase involved in cell wall biosynthesis
MITLNEEKFLRNALESIKNLVDEIIIVDTGSTDNTKEIAQEYTDNIFDKPWTDNFSDARNYSLSKATQEWILVLDADEVIASEDHDRIKKLTEHNDYLGHSFLQLSYVNDTTIFNYHPILEQTKYTKQFTGYISCEMIRLFKNQKDIRYTGAVHESVLPDIKKIGTVNRTTIPIHHYQFEKETNIEKKQLHYLNIHEKNIDTYPNKAKAHRDIASTYYNYKHNYTKAIEHFNTSLELDNNNVKTYMGLALCYIKLHQNTNAQHILEKGLTQFPENKELTTLLHQINQ